MIFYVTITESEYGFSISCPTLKGCHSQGESEEDAIANIKEAIKEYIESLEEIEKKSGSKLVKIEVPV